MIIPVKCQTCGKVLADKYLFYVKTVRELKKNSNADYDEDDDNDVVYLTKNNTNKTAEGIVMDQLKLTKPCCRRTMLTHVDIM
tara:strand:+ start:2685 stop:2933 length:249 start_codon:yes stop_codon:yes gene_type:complete